MRRAGRVYVPFFAIAGAKPGAGGTTDPEELRTVVRAHGATTTRVRLAWTLQRGPHVLVIPGGTGDPNHLAENMAAANLRLSPEELTVF